VANPLESPLFILGTAHCHDMHAPSEADPPSLTWARQQIAEAVARWVRIGAHKKQTAEEMRLGAPSQPFEQEVAKKEEGDGMTRGPSSSWLLALGSLCLGVVIGAVSMLVLGTRRLGSSWNHLPVASSAAQQHQQMAAPLLQLQE
jgi:hypothetical protein